MSDERRIRTIDVGTSASRSGHAHLVLGRVLRVALALASIGVILVAPVVSATESGLALEPVGLAVDLAALAAVILLARDVLRRR